MQIELLPGLTNVIRFPLEERVRPSIMLLHEIEPDVREVLNLAEAFQSPVRIWIWNARRTGRPRRISRSRSSRRSRTS